MIENKILVLDDSYGLEFRGKYVFKPLTWARRNRILQKHTKYTATGAIASEDLVAIQAETITESLFEQPESHPVTLERMLDEKNGLPIGLGELFSKISNELNNLGHMDIRFLLGQLSENDRILLFQSFGYAKSSDGLLENLQGSQQEPSSSS